MTYAARHLHQLQMYRTNALQTSVCDLPWSHRLSRILRPTSSRSLPTFIPRPPSYPSGEIWKHIFSVCVYSDLAGPGCRLLWGKTNRRFARFERIGLGGVILYEIPVICGSMGWVRPAITVEEVTGDETSTRRLLELTNAKVVYFPAYACTSFTMGQVMHAFLTSDQNARPYPAHDGFYVFPDGKGGDYHEGALMDDRGDSSIDSLGPDTPPRVNSPGVREAKGVYVMELANVCYYRTM